MKRFTLCILALLIALTSIISVSALEVSDSYLHDYEGLLTDTEVAQLSNELQRISETYQCDVVIVTSSDLEGKSPQAYADDFFDYNGFGYGDTHDGILLFVSLTERKWTTSTKGKGSDIFTDSALDNIEDSFTPLLSSGDYSTAFNTFAELCEEELATYGKFQFSFFYVIMGSVAGVIIAFIAVLIMKGQLKSVRYQAAAQNYIRSGSFNVTERNDIFLYSTVSRRAKPKDTDSGGSSTHRSSSGSTHGGHSGSF